MFSLRVRRQGGGGKPASETQPGLLEALNDLVQSSIRGDPEAALLWVSKSQRRLAAAFGHRSSTAQCPQRRIITAAKRPGGFAQQGREVDPADPGHGSEDQHVLSLKASPDVASVSPMVVQSSSSLRSACRNSRLTTRNRATSERRWMLAASATPSAQP